jgi:hypothetical protein
MAYDNLEPTINIESKDSPWEVFAGSIYKSNPDPNWISVKLNEPVKINNIVYKIEDKEPIFKVESFKVLIDGKWIELEDEDMKLIALLQFMSDAYSEYIEKASKLRREGAFHMLNVIQDKIYEILPGGKEAAKMQTAFMIEE